MNSRRHLRASVAGSLVMSLALAGIALIVPVSVAAAGSVTCTYSGTFHKVTVTMLGGVATTLRRSPAGNILVGGDWCGGAATVTNTNSIVVTGDGGNQKVTISLANTGFVPGIEAEGGPSEVEILVYLGGGANDRVVVVGTNSRQHIVLGRADANLNINLNGSESGLDTDVFLNQVEMVTIKAKGGNDTITGQGLSGTGPDPFDVPLVVYGGKGNDLMVGGIAGDRLFGNPGADTASGDEGDDLINLVDGVEANDGGDGGLGTDTCAADIGDVCHD